MNLRQLPYFIDIAETGSLSAAARRAGLTQPTISSYLRNLEQELGTPLFVRQKQRLTLTEAGTVYLDMAQQILNLQARTHTMIQALHGPQKKAIRMGLSPHRGAQTLPAIYQPFIKHFPDFDIEPVDRYIDEFELLRTDQLDLAFATVALPFSDPTLHILPMQNEEIVLALPTFHRLAPQASHDVTSAPGSI